MRCRPSRCAGRGGATGAALSQQRRAGQVVVVDRRVEDGAKQRQVGVDGAGREPSAISGLPGSDGAGVQIAEGMSPKVGRMRFSPFFLVPYSDLGCWSFQAGHHLVVTYSPTGMRALRGSRSAGSGSGWRSPRSIARFLASARRLVGKMPAER